MIRQLNEGTALPWEWIDLFDPTDEELQTVARQHQLNPWAVQDSLQPDHLPKYETHGDSVFIITRAFDKEVNEQGDTVQDLTNKIAIFLNEKYIITIHRLEIPLLAEIEKMALHKGKCDRPHNLFIQIIKSALVSYEEPALKLAKDLDYFESKVFLRKTKFYPLTNGLYWLKRKAEVTRRVLTLTKVILDNLSKDHPQDPEVQDVNDLFLRLQTMYDEINDSTNHLLAIYIGLASQRTNEVMRILTIFSVFFLPLTFVVGIYGMNFKYMPELGSKWGYPLTLAALLAITISIFFWFKKKQWL